jgi:hypothetical protein
MTIRTCLLWCLLASPIPAAPQLLNCTNGGTKFGVVAITATVPVNVAPSATGAGDVCQALSATPSTWFVKVTQNGGGTWTWTLISSFKASVPPPVPPPVAVPAPAAILSWSAPATDTAGKPITVPLTYNVYRGTSATTLTKLTSTSVLTYTDPGSAVATTYFYAVTATCAACTESAESGVVSATIKAAALSPSAPSGLVVH